MFLFIIDFITSKFNKIEFILIFDFLLRGVIFQMMLVFIKYTGRN